MMAKRLLDLMGSALGLIVLSPLFLVVGLLIWANDRGPVFFRQERIGQGGRPFLIWKFRTMVMNAEALGSPLTVGRDPRITRVGHWLRKTKIDELPQLINVLLGQMSLVGPRPEVAAYVALYTPEQREVLQLRPGITDPASLRFRNEQELLAQAVDPEGWYVEVIMPEKIRLNLEYGRRASVRTDLGLVWLTVWHLLIGG